VNIVRPANYSGAKLPVALWIHGGGYYAGSGIEKAYNLSFIVANSVKIGKPIIGMTINYRLAGWVRSWFLLISTTRLADMV
jgi:carboxylesterase type B